MKKFKKLIIGLLLSSSVVLTGCKFNPTTTVGVKEEPIVANTCVSFLEKEKEELEGYEDVVKQLEELIEANAEQIAELIQQLDDLQEQLAQDVTDVISRIEIVEIYYSKCAPIIDMLARLCNMLENLSDEFIYDLIYIGTFGRDSFSALLSQFPEEVQQEHALSISLFDLVTAFPVYAYFLTRVMTATCTQLLLMDPNYVLADFDKALLEAEGLVIFPLYATARYIIIEYTYEAMSFIEDAIEKGLIII